MKNAMLAGLVVAPLLLAGCANPADQSASAAATESSASAEHQVTLKITGMT